MARPESQAIAGHFPTPDHLVPAIASLVVLERERYAPTGLLRPLRGDRFRAGGARCGGPRSRARRGGAGHRQAIGFEATRAEALSRRLPQGGARSGDALTFGIAASPGASVLFLNPPYDTDREHRRLEQRFLARFTDALAPGGAPLRRSPHGARGIGRASRLALHQCPSLAIPGFRLRCLQAGRRRGRASGRAGPAGSHDSPETPRRGRDRERTPGASGRRGVTRRSPCACRMRISLSTRRRSTSTTCSHTPSPSRRAPL